MTNKKIGNIIVISGKNEGRYPYVNSIIMEGGEIGIIDPHSDKEFMKKLAEIKRVKKIIHSHFHWDHTRYTDFFTDALIYVHKLDAPVYKSLEKFGEYTGLKERYGTAWTEQQDSLKWKKRIPDVEFKDGDIIHCGETSFKVIHTPGHSPGHSCFLFPEEELLYLADIDLTDFGPWYGNPSANLEDFINSVKKVMNLQAEHYVSSHEAGILNRESFMEKIEKYNAKFHERENAILEFLSSPKNLDEIVSKGIIYKMTPRKAPWMIYAERRMILQHINRLMKSGAVIEKNGIYLKG